jgi:phosphatidate phosphatase PAH1
MKLGEGGEAFFVFQTDGDIPEYMQTSPVPSPSQSPVIPAVIPDMVKSVHSSCFLVNEKSAMGLQEPDYLDLNKANGKLDGKADDVKSESNVQLHRGIDIIRPASTDGTPPLI